MNVGGLPEFMFGKKPFNGSFQIFMIRLKHFFNATFVAIVAMLLASCVTGPTTRENETWLWVSPTFEDKAFNEDLVDCGEIVNGRRPVYRTSTPLSRSGAAYQAYTTSILLNLSAAAVASAVDKSTSKQLHEHCRFENISGDPCGVFFSCLVERGYRGVPLTQADRRTFLRIQNDATKATDFRRKVGTIVKSSDYNPNFKY